MADMASTIDRLWGEEGIKFVPLTQYAPRRDRRLSVSEQRASADRLSAPSQSHARPLSPRPPASPGSPSSPRRLRPSSPGTGAASHMPTPSPPQQPSTSRGSSSPGRVGSRTPVRARRQGSPNALPSNAASVSATTPVPPTQRRPQRQASSPGTSPRSARRFMQHTHQSQQYADHRAAAREANRRQKAGGRRSSSGGGGGGHHRRTSSLDVAGSAPAEPAASRGASVRSPRRIPRSASGSSLHAESPGDPVWWSTSSRPTTPTSPALSPRSVLRKAGSPAKARMSVSFDESAPMVAAIDEIDAVLEAMNEERLRAAAEAAELRRSKGKKGGATVPEPPAAEEQPEADVGSARQQQQQQGTRRASSGSGGPAVMVTNAVPNALPPLPLSMLPEGSSATVSLRDQVLAQSRSRWASKGLAFGEAGSPTGTISRRRSSGRPRSSGRSSSSAASTGQGDFFFDTDEAYLEALEHSGLV
jgi:hypothetical protein